jgi:hypothetical protein
MSSRDIKDVVGGICLICIGVFAAYYAQRYPIGELRRMGPGFFPFSLGILLAILGAFVAIPAWFRSGESLRIQGKGFLWIMVSVMIFAFGLAKIGVVLSTVAAVIAASMASTLTWRSTLILAAAVALITYVVFSLGLGMAVPVWPRLD